MIAVSIPRPGRHSSVGRWLRQAVAWWIGELAGLLPRAAVGWLTAGGRPQAVLEFSAGEASLVLQPRGRMGPAVIPLGEGEGPAAARVRRQYAGLKVPIHLDAACVFEASIDLPLAAERSLEPILRHQLERLVPLDPATLRFGWRVAERLPARKIVRVRIAIARQATLERATALAVRAGLAPLSISGGGSGGGGGGQAGAGEDAPFVLWQPHAGESVGPRQRRLRRGLEVAAGLLALAAYALHVEQLEGRRAALRAAVETARQQARVVQTLGQQAEQASRSLAFFAAKRAAPTPLAVLDTLTQLIPRDSWLEEFRLHGADVELIGYAPRATDVVARIEGAALFRDPAFRSPVTLAPDGRSERFELGFRVRAAAP